MVTGGGGEVKGIHRNWMTRAIISISFIRVRTVFQTGVWFFYKRSRLVSGSPISVPDRQLSGSGGKLGFRQHFDFLFSISIFCKNTKGDGGG